MFVYMYESKCEYICSHVYVSKCVCVSICM